MLRLILRRKNDDSLIIFLQLDADLDALFALILLYLVVDSGLIFRNFSGIALSFSLASPPTNAYIAPKKAQGKQSYKNTHQDRQHIVMRLFLLGTYEHYHN